MNSVDRASSTCMRASNIRTGCSLAKQFQHHPEPTRSGKAPKSHSRDRCARIHRSEPGYSIRAKVEESNKDVYAIPEFTR